MLMPKIFAIATGVLFLTLGSTIAVAKDTLFWNLTVNKITKLQLSVPGKDNWGPDQTANDSDHSVDADERLKITDVVTGTYDVLFSDDKKRSCKVGEVKIEVGHIFSIGEDQLKSACQN